MNTIAGCLLGLALASALAVLVFADDSRHAEPTSTSSAVHKLQQAPTARNKNKRDEPKPSSERDREKIDIWKKENAKRDPLREADIKKKKKYYYKSYKENQSILRPDELSKLFENPTNHNYIKDFVPSSRISANAEYVDSRMEVNCERCRLCMEEHQRKVRGVREEGSGRSKREVDAGHPRLKKRKRKIRRRLPKKTTKKIAPQDKKDDVQPSNKTGFSVTTNDSRSVTYITKLSIPPLKSELLQVNETEQKDNETVTKCHIYQITKLMTCDSPEVSAIARLIKKAEGSDNETGAVAGASGAPPGAAPAAANDTAMAADNSIAVGLVLPVLPSDNSTSSASAPPSPPPALDQLDDGAMSDSSANYTSTEMPSVSTAALVDTSANETSPKSRSSTLAVT